MVTAAGIYDDHPTNWVAPQIDHTATDQVMRAFGNRGPNTPTEMLACAAVLHRNGADDLAEMVGIGYAVVGT